MVHKNPKKKILYFVTEDWYFCSHRLPLARAAKSEGKEVIVVARTRDHGDIIRSEGIKLIPLDTNRRSRNPFAELKTLHQLSQIYKSEKPDIVHNIAIKPVIYGSIATMFSSVPYIVNSVNGLGYIFTTKQLVAKLIRPIFKLLFFIAFNRKNSRVIVQNPDDKEVLVDSCHVDPNRVTLIRGSGVNMDKFYSSSEREGIPLVVMASRMIWDKGVGEFVEAANHLSGKGVKAKFALVGESDTDNPAGIPINQLKTWQNQGVVEWWGKREDMPDVFAQSHVVCLPSAYGEGVPKVLIEAAAAGRAIVTTDMPGCREIVRHNQNGLLVPVRNVTALSAAIKQLIEDPNLRNRMGQCGREIAENEFAIERVVTETMKVYRALLG